MCELRLPRTLTPLFSDLPRIVEVDAATVDEAIDRLDDRWPGLRDSLCEPGPSLRMHIHVYVDQERADLDTPVERALDGSGRRRDQRGLGRDRDEGLGERGTYRPARRRSDERRRDTGGSAQHAREDAVLAGGA